MILVIVLVFLFAFSVYEGWVFLGKPGWTAASGDDGTKCVSVYYYDNAIIYLVPVQRRVEQPGNMSLTALALNELAKAPGDPSLARIYPAIDPPDVYIDGGEAVVDLPPEIWDHFGDVGRQRAFFDAITLTVRDAGECTGVRILVGSQMIDSTPEGFNISETLTPPDNINLVPDLSLDGESEWVTAWFRDSTGSYFIPLGLEIQADVEPAEEALRKLLGEAPQLAYPPPVRVSPVGCRLEKINIESGVATVDILVTDAGPLFDTNDVTKLRTAMFLTLRDCCDVRDVRLKLNGRDVDSYSRFADLPGDIPTTCWNLERAVVTEEGN